MQSSFRSRCLPCRSSALRTVTPIPVAPPRGGLPQSSRGACAPAPRCARKQAPGHACASAPSPPPQCLGQQAEKTDSVVHLPLPELRGFCLFIASPPQVPDQIDPRGAQGDDGDNGKRHERQIANRVDHSALPWQALSLVQRRSMSGFDSSSISRSTKCLIFSRSPTPPLSRQRVMYLTMLPSMKPRPFACMYST